LILIRTLIEVFLGGPHTDATFEAGVIVGAGLWPDRGQRR
jgi:hypothetical protein